MRRRALSPAQGAGARGGKADTHSRAPPASTERRWSARSAGACGVGEGTAAGAGREDRAGRLAAGRGGGPSSRGSGREHPRLRLTGLGGSPAPRVLPRLPCVPRLFQEGDGAPSGGGARRAGPGCHVPPTRPRHCGGSSNQSAPGGSSRAGTTRLRGGGWAAVT